MCRVCVPCVCVCECVTIWIIKCTFYALFFFTALSTNFLYFVALQTDTLEGAQGVGWCDGVWSRDARVTYNLGWVKYKKKTHNGKTRRKLQTGHVQKCTNTFQLDCVSVCVCTKVQAPLEKSKRTTRDRNGRKAVSLSKSTRPSELKKFIR